MVEFDQKADAEDQTKNSPSYVLQILRLVVTKSSPSPIQRICPAAIYLVNRIISLVYRGAAWYTSALLLHLSQAYVPLYTMERFHILCSLLGTKSLDYYATKYWRKYLKSSYEMNDGRQLIDQDEIISHRSSWLEFEMAIAAVWRNKRLVKYDSVFSKCLYWFVRQCDETTPYYHENELHFFLHFPNTF